jgi:hypothetical protein
MDEDQLLLVLTICDLLDKSTTIKLAEAAYRRAQKQLDRRDERQAGKVPKNQG